MPDTIQRLDIVHDAQFSRPAFELLREVPSVLSGFYDFLAPRFQLSTEHISVATANVLADVLLRIGMYNNTASLELRAERMVIRLPNVNNQESIEIAKAIIESSHAALKKCLPNVELDASNFVGHMWLALEGGLESAEQLLQRNAAPATPIDPSLFGAENHRYNLRYAAQNNSAGWTISVFGEPSVVPGSHLFLSMELSYRRHGLLPIEEQIEAVSQRLPQVLVALGLKLQETKNG